jgi:alpha,alpha-trehalose-phosphate synthase [UDP-forming]/trehalose-phosphatase
VYQHEHWVALARWTPLAIVSDLDGTLLPFASTPDEARPGADLMALIQELASLPGVTMAVVSGRPRETLEAFFGASDGLLLVAEHGGWRRGRGAWEPLATGQPDEVESLREELQRVAARYPGALIERKTWSVAFHFRGIATEERDAAEVEVEHRVHAWLARHTGFEELRGVEVLEIRPARMDKASAVPWLREHAGERCRLLALGDDVTDEDMFRSLAAEDESVVVGIERDRPTAARWRLDGVDDARRFLKWLIALRRGDGDVDASVCPRPVEPASSRPDAGLAPYRLLVVSNRLPELRSAADTKDARKRNVGGLVSALEPALRARQGVWLGWSGRTAARADATRFGLDESANPKLAWVDFPEEWQRHYYNGLCNSALWPLLHSFPSRVRLAERDWTAYREANTAFAAAASRLVGPSDMVWVHDYHLLLLGQKLRERGHDGPIGLFSHVPFPGPDLFYILPWAEEVLMAMLDLDLVGFHTQSYAANFRSCVAAIPGTRVGDDVVEYRTRRTRIGAFPIGIIPQQFQGSAAEATAEAANLMRAIAPNRLVLGVDRLDYTKGIPERLSGFARLLELYPEWRRKVSLVQISVPSRGDVPDYAEQRERVEHIVGRTNGEFGDADWVPIRYLYRSFSREQLSLLYRSAAVGYVTPLRDGMNLVAKEYVAAQDPADPGVLLLSRFAGAAAELTDALLTNPWYVDGLARDLDRALRMPREERLARHEKLLGSVARTTAISWAEDFLSTLARCAKSGDLG